MSKLQILLLLIGLPLLMFAQKNKEVEIVEYNASAAVFMATNYLVLDEAGRKIFHETILVEKSIQTDYTYKGEDIKGEYYYEAYGDSVVENGFSVIQLKEGKIQSKKYFDASGDQSGSAIYTYEEGKLVNIKAPEIRPNTNEVITVDRKIIYNLDGKIEAEQVIEEGRFLRSILYEHQPNQVTIKSIPTKKGAMFFEQTYEFESDRLKSFDLKWQHKEEAQMVIDSRINKTILYKKNGLIQKIVYRAYDGKRDKAFLVTPYRYNIKTKLEMTPTMIQKINAAILEANIAEARNFKEYGW